MKTSNAMQLKARIKAHAKALGVSPQLLLQDYLLERLLVRLSESRWRDFVIVKGGMLISSLVGVSGRVTKDLDTTVRGFTLTHESAEQAFRDICSIQAADDLTFEFLRCEDIREADEYPGIRVFVKAHYDPMSVPLSVDVTTGDVITPAAIEYDYPLVFDEGSVRLMTYPIETCLAEKIETIISRGIANTRPRDFYDITMLWKMRAKEVDTETLARAITATCSKRGSLKLMAGYMEAMAEICSDKVMNARWLSYTKDYSYAAGLSFNDVCTTICRILDWCWK